LVANFFKEVFKPTGRTASYFLGSKQNNTSEQAHNAEGRKKIDLIVIRFQSTFSALLKFKMPSSLSSNYLRHRFSHYFGKRR
jgi:hypothetical protein